MKIPFKLREKLILITVSTILLVTGVNTYLNISDFIRVYKERVVERVFIQIRPLKTIIEDVTGLGLTLADLSEIDRECQNMVKSIDYALYCFVTDNQGKVYYHSSPEQAGSVYSDPVTQAALKSKRKQVQVFQLDSGEKAYDFSLPLEKPNGERVGLIRFGIQYRIIDEEVSRLIRRAVMLGVFSVVFAGLLVFLLSKYSILRPVRQLVEGITKFGRGDLDSRVNMGTKDEIGELANSYNNMAQSILEYITERKKMEEQLLYDAFHDALTGLPNRALFIDRLTHAIAIAKRRKDYFFAVLFIDLDSFKVINDSLGHTAGDQLLVLFGQRLLKCLRPGDTISRLGGDEFTFLLEDIGNISNATIISERILNKLAAPFNIADQEIFTTASIGIALNLPGYDSPEQLLRDADTAMYQAKAHGRANYVVFESGMHIRAVERLRIDTDLRRAVERKEFIVYYQPILSIETKGVIGYEALVRWKHPERGILYPADFIRIAEETGLIVSIDRFVLREACQQMHEWQMQFPESSLRFINVNLSNKQMSQPDLVEYVSHVLNETGLNPGCLKLEITENVIIENPEFTSNMLSKLRTIGVLIYIDDFGTGYSSLSYIHQLPIDGLKIDRSFIRRMGDRGENQEIIKVIMMMARDMNINVIAEGIETENQLTQIESLKCEYWQGYLFSKPVDSEQARDLMERKIPVISSTKAL